MPSDTLIKFLRESGSILGKTFLVVAVLALSLGLWEKLGLPSWAQCFAFMPAGYVYARLAGERLPSWRRWMPWMICFAGLSYVFVTFSPHLPEPYKTGFFGAYFLFGASLIRGLARRGSHPKP